MIYEVRSGCIVWKSRALYLGAFANYFSIFWTDLILNTKIKLFSIKKRGYELEKINQFYD